MLNEAFHAVVWLDHDEAKIFHFSSSEVERLLIRARDSDHVASQAAGPNDGSHGAGRHSYYQRIADAIADAGAVLITGPAGAKTELLTYVAAHDAALLPRIADVQTLEPSHDAALLALAREYFRRDDRAHPRR